MHYINNVISSNGRRFHVQWDRSSGFVQLSENYEGPFYSAQPAKSEKEAMLNAKKQADSLDEFLETR